MFKKFRDGRDSKKTKEKVFLSTTAEIIKNGTKTRLRTKKLHIYSAATRFTVEMGRALTFFGFELLPQA